MTGLNPKIEILTSSFRGVRKAEGLLRMGIYAQNDKKLKAGDFYFS
jgi:hypothetical protein